MIRQERTTVENQKVGTCVRQNTRKQMSSCSIINPMKVPRMIFSLFSLIIESWMALSHTPARKPPRCPQQSIELLEEEGVKMKMKTMMSRAWHHIWHFIEGPTRSRPFQFMMTQPMIIPMMPKREVEAPAFTPIGEQSKLNMLPLMPATRQATTVRGVPKVYSILERNMKVVMTFPKICMKQICMKMAERIRQTCPASTFGWQLPPYQIRVSGFTINRFSEVRSSPTETRKMKKAMSIRVIRKVKERNLKVGQRAYASMSQQLSSWGFLTDLRPDMKRIRCYSAILSCYSRTGSLKPPRILGSLSYWSGLGLRIGARLRRFPLEPNPCTFAIQ